MKELRCTLLTDGPRDRALIPVLQWVLRQQVPLAVNIDWADLRRLSPPPRQLAARVAQAVRLFPCDLLLVHRDAESEPRQRRLAEIEKAVAAVDSWDSDRTVAVVPERRTEAWLLIDEAALRSAAGNARGSAPLSMPALQQLEGLPDPKKTLHGLLRAASGLPGRRQKRFRMDQAVHRLAQTITDYSPLRQLSAFRALEEEIEQIVAGKGWR